MMHCFAGKSLRNVVLLKKNHGYNGIDMDEFYKSMLNNYIDNVKVERHTFNDIAELFGVRNTRFNL